MRKIIILVFLISTTIVGYSQQRIVSLSGGISEILVALGLENQIVGVDITSNYPASLKTKTQVGHNRNISTEGVISLNPTLVLGIKDQINPNLENQLTDAKIPNEFYQQELSIGGIKTLVNKIAVATHSENKATQVIKTFDKNLNAVSKKPVNKKVLFIYARGAGTMMVAGTGTPIERMLQFAGATNAITDFKDYKPLTPEALAVANPDVILLFDSGLKSIGGIDGLLKVPGVSATPAGKNKKIVSMDGELLSGFSLRTPQAVKELQEKLSL